MNAHLEDYNTRKLKSQSIPNAMPADVKHFHPNAANKDFCPNTEND